MIDDRIINEYFEWMYDLVCGLKFPSTVTYRKLLMQLHSTEFTYLISNDANRAEDGVDLRYRFACIYGYDDTPECLDGPCSVLEMMIALAIRCEESAMDDSDYGDRTGQWFWGMINNLGLGSMMDNNYDRMYVTNVIHRFLRREYEPDGKGGLFRVRRCTHDLRDIEIWYQLHWYLDSIG